MRAFFSAIQSYPLAALVLLEGIIGVGIVLWARAKQLNAFRPDVPRSVREPRIRMGVPPLDVEFGDYFTVAGRRWRALALGATPAVILAILGGMGLSDGPGPAYARIVGTLSVAIWAVILALGLRVRNALRAERRIVAVAGADGRFHVPSERAAVAEFGPEHRRLCDCCGFPTVDPNDHSRSCDLCDWAADLDAHAPELGDARRNFAEHRTIFGASAPEWRNQGLSADEREERERAVRRLEAAKRSPAGFDSPELWSA